MNYKNIDRRKVFIGFVYDEAYYISLEDDDVRGRTFEGLRPATEDKLRKRQRDIDIEEFYNIPDELKSYIDYERFSDDMEDCWYEYHDVQGEIEDEDGEIYYMGFGSGQDIFGYFNKNNIVDYETYAEHFEEVGLTEKEFDGLINLIDKRKDKNDEIYGIGTDQGIEQDKTRLIEKKEFEDWATLYNLI